MADPENVIFPLLALQWVLSTENAGALEPEQFHSFRTKN